MAEEDESQADVSIEDADRIIRDTLYHYAIECVRGKEGRRASVHGMSMHTPSLSAYVMARAAERQEETLKALQEESKAMRKHSDSMRWQSWVMLALTVLLMFLVIAQIVIAIIK